MPLWKVALIGGREAASYDEYDSYVARADSAEQARALARLLTYAWQGDVSWRRFLDPSASTCTVIEAEGSPEIVVESFHYG